MPITLNHSNIGVQYSSDKSYIIETVKSDLYRRNEIVDTIVRDNIQTAPVTPSIYIENGTNNVYAVESYTYSGTANTTDFTRVFTNSTTCDILLVGGGGAGAGTIGGGGGAGSLIFAKNATLNGTYTINVGKGGIGGLTGQGTKGNSSSISKDGINITAEGGGASGRTDGNQNGGSGGGGDYWEGNQTRGTSTSYTSTAFGATIVKYGNNGANAYTSSPFNGGGGGGAGGSALIATSTNLFSNGGSGLHQVIIGVETINFATIFGINTSVVGGVLSNGNLYYAGGGGAGGNESSLGGTGGIGGGGNGGPGVVTGGANIPIHGSNGLPNTGGGGGGGSNHTSLGGNGGSGIVIIRYLLGTIPTTNLLTNANEPTITSPTFTETITTFAHSGGAETQTTHTITVGRDTICDILIVGGGGGGGKTDAGGGGAGGLIYIQNITLFGNYTIQVGKKGLGGKSASNVAIVGGKGGNSSIIGTNANYIAYGGGGGGYGYPSDVEPSNLGPYGSSGGLGTSDQTRDSFNINTPGQGNLGGLGTAAEGGGGGGGSGGPGVNSGNGGIGTQINITGTNLYYAGGGGGGHNPSGTSGGLGGGGSANFTTGNNATFYGGGGGGGGGNWGNGGDGFDGIVIIKFKSTTAILDGITHKRLNFAYTQNYPFIQADNTNLKAWYKFDGDYMDSSPSGFNLTNSGATIVDGLIVQSLSTDASDFLETSGINLNGKTYSISFWLKLNTAPSTNTVPLFTQGITDSTSTRLIFLYIYESGNMFLRFSHYGPGNDINAAGYNISSMVGTSWHHYVVTYNNTNRGAEIWFDGIKLNTNTSTFANTFTGSGNFTIARWIGTTFNGLMEDFRYYDKVLTSIEITQLYNIPTTNQYTVNFPVPTIADINNNSNIVLRGSYDIALSTSNAVIIPKEGQHIHNPSVLIRDSSERIYPPVRNFTTDTTIISGQTYGNGTYIVSASTFYVGEDTFKIFNGTNSGWTQSTSKYDGSPAGTYTGLLSLGGFTGEWIKVQLPVSIKLTRYIIEASSIGGVNRAPSIYKIFGSNNNIDWEQVVYKSVPLVSADYISSKYEEKVSSNNYYRFFALVIGKNIGLDVWLGIGEWYIYGQEFSNNSLSIRYNILNPILDPIGAQWTYNSSNTNVYHMGSVGIGTTNPEYQLDVRGAIYSSVGGYTQTGLTTWTVTSDKRIKDNIVRASYDKCLENVKNIELYNFNFKNNCVNTNDKHQLGFIAQEVREVYPKAVEVGKMILNTNEAIDDILTLNTTQIDYTLYGAVKNLIEKIDNIDIELENLDSNITYNKDLIRNTSNISITTSNIFTGT